MSRMRSSKSPARKPLVSQKVLKKNVGLIHSSSALGLVERKLFNWLLLESYDRLGIDDTHELPLPLLKAMMGWEASNNNDGLDAAMKGLMGTIVHFNLVRPRGAEESRVANEEAWEATTLLSYAAVIGGRAAWRFDRSMAAKLRDPSVFHWLNVASAQGLQSAFAYALYENTARFYKVGQTPRFDIPLLRELLNATATSYDDFRYFKQRVITPATVEINTITDIEIEPRYERSGRSVVSVQFNVRVKPQSSLLAKRERTRVDLAPEEQQMHDRMCALGLSPKAAINLIEARGVDTVAQAVVLTEEKLRSGGIISNAAAYLRKVAESGEQGSFVTSRTFVAKQAAERFEETKRTITAQSMSVVETIAERQRRTTEIALLSLDQRRLAAVDFIARSPAAEAHYDAALAKFTGNHERLFGLFLRGWKPTT